VTDVLGLHSGHKSSTQVLGQHVGAEVHAGPVFFPKIANYGNADQRAAPFFARAARSEGRDRLAPSISSSKNARYWRAMTGQA
jgi:hypothetical protein